MREGCILCQRPATTLAAGRRARCVAGKCCGLSLARPAALAETRWLAPFALVRLAPADQANLENERGTRSQAPAWRRASNKHAKTAGPSRFGSRHHRAFCGRRTSASSKTSPMPSSRAKRVRPKDQDVGDGAFEMAAPATAKDVFEEWGGVRVVGCARCPEISSLSPTRRAILLVWPGQASRRPEGRQPASVPRGNLGAPGLYRD